MILPCVVFELVLRLVGGERKHGSAAKHGLAGVKPPRRPHQIDPLIRRDRRSGVVSGASVLGNV